MPSLRTIVARMSGATSGEAVSRISLRSCGLRTFAGNGVAVADYASLVHPTNLRNKKRRPELGGVWIEVQRVLGAKLH